ncbi:MAG: ferrous iron transport protein B [Synergistaceae bacterium]|jgi:ferrous iron transport protein B|nr:ferrous iron transport protein B [Synergistaceae bacterium]
MIFALAGNPNSGKTTLFNLLTGSSAHVGNWPGVTVDRREGVYRGLRENVDIIDLPGIYSLSPYTPEETVSRRYILDNSPDLVIDIVDSTNLERNLYLTTQILESDIPVVIALNMSDITRKEGNHIDASLLADRFGVPVVEISAIDRDGVKELMDVAYKTALTTRAGWSPLERSPLGESFERVIKLFRGKNVPHPVFHAAKAVEGDILEADATAGIKSEIDEIKNSMRLGDHVAGDFEAAVADIRYNFIAEYCSGALRRAGSSGDTSRSDRIDMILTNKLFGLPIFFLVMFMVFHLTFSESLVFSGYIAEDGIPSPGIMFQGWMELFTDWLSASARGLLDAANAPAWLGGILINGLLNGVGSVLSFLPQILMLFLFLSILEDSGYMARAALLMDRPLRRFGLSGRAFLPMLMGFGCSVPAMMGSRTLATASERRFVIMLMPFFSCGAKLPIWSLFGAAIFPSHADLAVFGMYLIGIAAAVAAAIILRHTIMKDDASFFIMELPAYRMPRPRNLCMHLWEKASAFITRATTIIAGAAVIIWFLSNFDFTLNMVEPNSRDSIVGIAASFALPIFRPLGFAGTPDAWKAIVAIVTGLIAKEMVVSTLGVLYTPEIGADALEDEHAAGALSLALVGSFSHAAALSFMTFNLLSIPCMAAVATARMELRSARHMAETALFWLATAWVGSFVVYRAASIIGI